MPKQMKKPSEKHPKKGITHGYVMLLLCNELKLAVG